MSSRNENVCFRNTNTIVQGSASPKNVTAPEGIDANNWESHQHDEPVLQISHSVSVEEQVSKENKPAHRTSLADENPLLNFTQLLQENSLEGGNGDGSIAPTSVRREGEDSDEDDIEYPRRDEPQLETNISCISTEPIDTAEDGKYRNLSEGQSPPESDTCSNRHVVVDKEVQVIEPHCFNMPTDAVFYKVDEEESFSHPDVGASVEVQSHPQINKTYAMRRSVISNLGHNEGSEEEAPTTPALIIDSVAGSSENAQSNPPSVNPPSVNPPSEPVSETTISVPSVNPQLDDQPQEYQDSSDMHQAAALQLDETVEYGDYAPQDGNALYPNSLESCLYRSASNSNPQYGSYYQQDYNSTNPGGYLIDADKSTPPYSIPTTDSSSTLPCENLYMSGLQPNIFTGSASYQSDVNYYKNQSYYYNPPSQQSSGYYVDPTLPASYDGGGSFSYQQPLATDYQDTSLMSCPETTVTSADTSLSQLSLNQGFNTRYSTQSSIPSTAASNSFIPGISTAPMQSGVSVLSGWNARSRTTTNTPIWPSALGQASSTTTYPSNVIGYQFQMSNATQSIAARPPVYQAPGCPDHAYQPSTLTSMLSPTTSVAAPEVSFCPPPPLPVWSTGDQPYAQPPTSFGPNSYASTDYKTNQQPKQTSILRHFLTSNSPIAQSGTELPAPPQVPRVGDGQLTAPVVPGPPGSVGQVNPLKTRMDRLTESIQTFMSQNGPKNKLQALYLFYGGRAYDIETRRRQTLCSVPPVIPVLRSINTSYDEEHHCLMDYVEGQLDTIRKDIDPKPKIKTQQYTFTSYTSQDFQPNNKKAQPLPRKNDVLCPETKQYTNDSTHTTTSVQQDQVGPNFYRECAPTDAQPVPVPTANVSVQEKVRTSQSSPHLKLAGQKYINKTPEKTLRKLKRFLPDGIKPLCSEPDDGDTRQGEVKSSSPPTASQAEMSITSGTTPQAYPAQGYLLAPASAPAVRTPLMLGPVPSAVPRLGQFPIVSKGPTGYSGQMLPPPTLLPHPLVAPPVRIGQPQVAGPQTAALYPDIALSAKPSPMVPMYSFNPVSACSNLSAYVCDYPAATTSSSDVTGNVTSSHHTSLPIKPSCSLVGGVTSGVPPVLQQRRSGGRKRETSRRSRKSQQTPPGGGEGRIVDSKKHATLNPLAVKIMQTWYDRNVKHPYPSVETAEVIAERGNIAVEQVKKWFANKRLRNKNTKSLSAIAALRKNAKLKELNKCLSSDD